MGYHQLMYNNHNIFTKKVFEKLAPRKLTSGQPKVLEYLYQHDGSMQVEIAQACQIEPATVTSLLSRMEKNHLIYRETKDGNRRSLYVYLTKTGHAKAVKVNQVFAETEEIALKGFSKEEKEDLIHYLQRVQKNLE